ncbi:MAG: hypothetical protein KAH32_01885 [Chlamydiia bacterium]|nr:hypothetical protein [Chlamydiia bacterium]
MKEWLLLGINISILTACGIIYYKVSENQKTTHRIQDEIAHRLEYLKSAVTSSQGAYPHDDVHKIQNNMNDLSNHFQEISKKMHRINDGSQGMSEVHGKINAVLEFLQAHNQENQEIHDYLKALETNKRAVGDSISKLNMNIDLIGERIRTVEELCYTSSKRTLEILDIFSNTSQYTSRIKRR